MARNQPKGVIPPELKEHCWKPGQSGNPKGRPKKVKFIPEILEKIAQEEGTSDGMTKIEVVLRKVFQYALEGKSWAVQFIADRTEGKALQSVMNINIEEGDIDGAIEEELEKLARIIIEQKRKKKDE